MFFNRIRLKQNAKAVRIRLSVSPVVRCTKSSNLIPNSKLMGIGILVSPGYWTKKTLQFDLFLFIDIEEVLNIKTFHISITKH